MEDDLNSWNLAKLACKHLKVYSRTAQNKTNKISIGWKMTCLEEDLNGRRPQWKKTSMEEDLNERQHPWKTTSMENKLKNLSF
jgi:hypothetical protein